MTNRRDLTFRNYNLLLDSTLTQRREFSKLLHEVSLQRSNDELTRRSAPSCNLCSYTAAVGAAKVRARHLQPPSTNFEFADDTYCPEYTLRVPPRLPTYISTHIPICAIRRAPFPYAFTLPSGRYCLLRPRFMHSEANIQYYPYLPVSGANTLSHGKIKVNEINVFMHKKSDRCKIIE